MLLHCSFFFIFLISFIFYTKTLGKEEELKLSTPMSLQAHNDRSRDYTIPDSGILPLQQTSGLPTMATGWQSPQSAPLFGGADFAASMQPGVPDGQMPAWDSSVQAGRPTFVSVPGTFHSQTFVPSSSAPPYSTSGTLPGPPPKSLPGYMKSSSFQHQDQVLGSQRVPQYGHQPNARPGGAPTTGQPPSYYA